MLLLKRLYRDAEERARQIAQETAAAEAAEATASDA